MAINPDDIEVVKQELEYLIDTNVPSWAKIMIPDGMVLTAALAILKALDDKHSGKVI